MTEQEDAISSYIEAARQEAHRYLEMGWSIIPLTLDRKPAIDWTEYQTRRPTEEEVDAWFDNGVYDGQGGVTKFFGLGLVTGAISNVVVLDCDNDEAIAYAVNEAGLWSGLTVKTARGQHFYFRHPGEHVSNKVGGWGVEWPDVKGLDLRGDGGFVVAPPTVRFDKDGGFRHQYAWNVKAEEVLDAFYALAPWLGIKMPQAVSSANGEWSFDSLRLDAVRRFGEGCWGEAKDRIKTLGRKMQDGDGRNAWLTKYCGECVAAGMDESELDDALQRFSDEFFDEPLPEREVVTTKRSVLATDRRNHPEKYEAAPAKPEDKPKAVRLITSATVSDLKKVSSGHRLLIDPFIPANSVIQVVGFNGHGKSKWLLDMLWAASSGQQFGSAYVERPLKVLYLDYELAVSTLSERVSGCESLLGPMGSNLAIWSAAASGMDMGLTTENGINALVETLKEVTPEIVVIDTVRSAWAGMDENSGHSWVKVNNLAVAIRNAGCSVVVVHHRNKPGQNGMGREAGSTAQLKDLDTQIIITKIVEDEEQAGREAALPDRATAIVDFKGVTRTAFSYLRMMLPIGFALRIVVEVGFGKLRQATENHQSTFIGWAEHIDTGKWTVVSSKTPRQKVLVMSEKMAMQPQDIAAALQIPVPTINRWLSSRRQP